MIKIDIYPSKKSIEIILDENNNYTIGGEILEIKYSKIYKIERATRNSKEEISNILLKTIDDKNELGAMIIEDNEIIIDNTDNLSMRSYASLVIIPKIDINIQTKLVKNFNEYLKINREKYNSLFLTNYRENKRKRISFELAFKIFGYLLENLN